MNNKDIETNVNIVMQKSSETSDKFEQAQFIMQSIILKAILHYNEAISLNPKAEYYKNRNILYQKLNSDYVDINCDKEIEEDWEKYVELNQSNEDQKFVDELSLIDELTKYGMPYSLQRLMKIYPNCPLLNMYPNCPNLFILSAEQAFENDSRRNTIIYLNKAYESVKQGGKSFEFSKITEYKFHEFCDLTKDINFYIDMVNKYEEELSEKPNADIFVLRADLLLVFGEKCFLNVISNILDDSCIDRNSLKELYCNELLFIKDYEKLNKFINEYPFDNFSQNYEYKMEIGDYDGAIDITKQEIKEEENGWGNSYNLSRLYIKLGIAYFNKGDFDYAYFNFKKAFCEKPSEVDLNNTDNSLQKDDYALFSKGLEEYELENYENAINYFNKAIEVNSNNSLYFLYRGDSNLAVKNYKLAIEDYNNALIINEGLPEAYAGRGIAYDRIGNYQEALNDYNMAIYEFEDDEYDDSFSERTSDFLNYISERHEKLSELYGNYEEEDDEVDYENDY